MNPFQTKCCRGEDETDDYYSAHRLIRNGLHTNMVGIFGSFLRNRLGITGRVNIYNLMGCGSMIGRSFRKKIRQMIYLYKRSRTVKLGLFKKLKMWKNGFLSESYFIYSLKDNDYKNYLSDYARFKKTAKINGYYSIILHDKLYFSKMLQNFKDYLPDVYGLIKDKRITLFGEHASVNVERFADFCKEKGSVVLKPIIGAEGEGIFVITTNNEKFIINGEVVSYEKYLSLIQNLENYLVIESIYQHKYCSEIFPHTVNTVRILTMFDDNDNEPFVATAIHRFGSTKSIPVDNWARGGYSCHICLDTGKLGKAAAYPSSGKLCFVSRHPETGNQIENVIVPRWNIIRNKTIEMAKALSYIPYIGWDIVVTKEKFKVLEGNNCTGVNLLQIHSPLLENPRVKRFYQKRFAMQDSKSFRSYRSKFTLKV